MQTSTPTHKIIKPINFLFYRTETTVDKLNTLFWVAPELFREAVSLQLFITGPIHWHYFGFTHPAKPFMLEISLPVAETIADYDGKFHFKRTDEFKCISVMHEGNWLEIPQSYQKIMQAISEQKLQPLSMNRELYINVDFNSPESNTTELQLGIA
jgi:effector-binding domain-containing protein